MKKKRVVKNIGVICLGVFTLFLAYDGPAMLQSTMNKENNIGATSQSILYGCFFLSALLLPKFVIKKLGTKVTFVLSMLAYIPYIAANYYPHWIVMIPASILIGLGASLLWGSQNAYLTDISAMYAELSFPDKKQSKVFNITSLNTDTNFAKWSENNSEILRPTTVNELKAHQGKEGIDNQQYIELSPGVMVSNNSNECARYATNKPEDLANKDMASVFEHGHGESNGKIENVQDHDESMKKQKIESITTKVFGIHGMAFLSCHIFGNLMSYFILSSTEDSEIKYSNYSAACGAQYCNTYSNISSDSNEDVSERTRYVLTTVCLALSIASVLIVAFFLDPLKPEADENSSSLQLFFATVKMVKREEILLLIPCSLYLGQIQGFFAGEFTKAFVGCSSGTNNVSLVSVVYGLFCILSATPSGWLIKICGRLLLFTATALLNTATIITLLLWVPNPNHPETYFIISGMMGIYNGVAWSQLRALYGLLFRADEDAAFAAFHMWYSLGFCVSFAYSGYFCTYVKLYVLLVVSSFGYIGYLIVERKYAIKSIKT